MNAYSNQKFISDFIIYLHTFFIFLQTDKKFFFSPMYIALLKRFVVQNLCKHLQNKFRKQTKKKLHRIELSLSHLKYLKKKKKLNFPVPNVELLS